MGNSSPACRRTEEFRPSAPTMSRASIVPESVAVVEQSLDGAACMHVADAAERRLLVERDFRERAEPAERSDGPRHQAFAARLVRRRRAPLEDERCESALRRVDRGGEPGGTPAAKGDVPGHRKRGLRAIPPPHNPTFRAMP